jgi:TP901 family phage tail tape measure protein
MKSIMTDIEKQSIPAIKDSIIDLAKTYGLSMEELGSSMYEILSSNFNPEFATKILEGSTKMATAGLSSLQEAVYLMITSINAYGYSMDDITTLSDAFFEAVKVGRFTIGELGEDFATAATTAAIFGIDIREVLTALATMKL